LLAGALTGVPTTVPVIDIEPEVPALGVMEIWTRWVWCELTEIVFPPTTEQAIEQLTARLIVSSAGPALVTSNASRALVTPPGYDGGGDTGEMATCALDVAFTLTVDVAVRPKLSSPVPFTVMVPGPPPTFVK